MAVEAEEAQVTSDDSTSIARMLSVPLGGWWRLSLLAATALALVVGLSVLMADMFRPLALFFFGIVIAEALTPVVGWLVNRRLSRGTAIVVVYLTILILVVLAGWLVLPPVVHQVTQGAKQLPSQLRGAEAYITTHTGVSTSALNSAATNAATTVATKYTALPIHIVTGLFDVVLIYFLSIYWMFASPALKRFFVSFFPEPKQEKVVEVLRLMGHDMGGYMRGSVISGFVTGVLAYFGLLIVGVQFALALGVLTFFGEFIPVIGVVIVGAIVVSVSLFQGVTFAVLALVVYVIILFLESHLISPNIMRSQTTVSQVLILFAVVSGYEVAGILGALVAIPLSAGLRVLVIEVFAPGVRKWAGAEPHPHYAEDEDKSKGKQDEERIERIQQSERNRGWFGIDNAFKPQNAAAFLTETIHRQRKSEERPERDKAD